MKKYDYSFEQNRSPKAEEFSPLSTSISDLFEHLQITHKFEEFEVAEAWRQLMGNKIADRTEKVSLRERTLFVKLESAPLKQELMMNKARILEKINAQNRDKKIIEEIKFL